MINRILDGGYSRVSRVGLSRLRFRVSVRVRVRF